MKLSPLTLSQVGVPAPRASCGSIRGYLQLTKAAQVVQNWQDEASTCARRVAVSPSTEEISGGAVGEKQPGNTAGVIVGQSCSDTC